MLFWVMTHHPISTTNSVPQNTQDERHTYTHLIICHTLCPAVSIIHTHNKSLGSSGLWPIPLLFPPPLLTHKIGNDDKQQPLITVLECYQDLRSEGPWPSLSSSSPPPLSLLYWLSRLQMMRDKHMVTTHSILPIIALIVLECYNNIHHAKSK